MACCSVDYAAQNHPDYPAAGDDAAFGSEPAGELTQCAEKVVQTL